VIPKERFAAFDLSEPIRPGRRFDLVQSFELAEHILASKAEIFIDSLVAHSDVILFSAAVAGQGSEFHIMNNPMSINATSLARRGFEIVISVNPILLTFGRSSLGTGTIPFYISMRKLWTGSRRLFVGCSFGEMNLSPIWLRWPGGCVI
jgi:hypothetical protein